MINLIKKIVPNRERIATTILSLIFISTFGYAQVDSTNSDLSTYKHMEGYENTYAEEELSEWVVLPSEYYTLKRKSRNLFISGTVLVVLGAAFTWTMMSDNGFGISPNITEDAKIVGIGVGATGLCLMVGATIPLGKANRIKKEARRNAKRY